MTRRRGSCIVEATVSRSTNCLKNNSIIFLSSSVKKCAVSNQSSSMSPFLANNFSCAFLKASLRLNIFALNLSGDSSEVVGVGTPKPFSPFVMPEPAKPELEIDASGAYLNSSFEGSSNIELSGIGGSLPKISSGLGNGANSKFLSAPVLSLLFGFLVFCLSSGSPPSNSSSSSIADKSSVPGSSIFLGGLLVPEEGILDAISLKSTSSIFLPE